MRGHGKCPVTICAEATTTEFLTITVSVSNVGSDRDICESCIEKAKDFAKQFSDLPLADTVAELDHALQAIGV